MASCYSVINSAYFNNIQAKINAVQTAQDLQNLVNSVYGQLQLLESTMTGEIALLGPIADILNGPGGNPSDIATWIGKFISSVLNPLYKQLASQTAQLAQINAQVATLTALINSVAAAKFPGVTINIPPINPNSCSIV